MLHLLLLLILRSNPKILMIKAFKFNNLVDLALIAMIEVAKIEVSAVIPVYTFLLSLFYFSLSLLILLVWVLETEKAQLSCSGKTLSRET